MKFTGLNIFEKGTVDIIEIVSDDCCTDKKQ